MTQVSFSSKNLPPKQHEAAVIILLLFSFSWGKGLRPLPVSTSAHTSRRNQLLGLDKALVESG